jgi:hypothetical protein
MAKPFRPRAWVSAGHRPTRPIPLTRAQTSALLCRLGPKTAALPLFPLPTVCTASTCTTPPVDLIPSHCGFIEKEKFLCHRSTSALGPLHLRWVVVKSPSRATTRCNSHRCRYVPQHHRRGWCLLRVRSGKPCQRTTPPDYFSPPLRVPHDDSHHRPLFGFATTPMSFA